ncbi:helix-turn-helix transcriptional regulator [Neoaquamicrobium sediminum]|uniref:helix-turn-helix transcriptional regulator n=1 Tax=Neoaquamicrobium sediminum TaxID=1849104 RepID=UPI00361B4AC6
MNNQLLSIRETCSRTTLSRTTLWQKVKRGEFPKPIGLGDGIRKAFVASEVDAWIAARVAERDEVAA